MSENPNSGRGTEINCTFLDFLLESCELERRCPFYWQKRPVLDKPNREAA